MNKKELKQLIDAMDVSNITIEFSQDDDDETSWLHISFYGSPKDKNTGNSPKA